MRMLTGLLFGVEEAIADGIIVMGDAERWGTCCDFFKLLRCEVLLTVGRSTLLN